MDTSSAVTPSVLPVAPSAAVLALVLDRAVATVADNVDTDAVTESAVRRITARIDASDIAAEIDVSDVAYNLDVSDVASNIDVSEVADNIDLSQLASNIDLSDLAERLNLDVLGDAVARSLGVASDVAELTSRCDDLAMRVATLESAAEPVTVREAAPAAAPVSDALLAAVRDAAVAALLAALNAAAAEGRL